MSDKDHKRPLRIINSHAPIRICDNGGWTDTWFARYGRVFNIGVHPCAEVQIEVRRADSRENRVVIHAENFGDHYALRPETPGWGRHPLLEATIERMRGELGTPVKLSVTRVGVDEILDFDLVRSEIAVKSVRAELLEPDMGYVRISQFSETTGAEMTAAILSLQDENGGDLTGVVLDLRPSVAVSAPMSELRVPGLSVLPGDAGAPSWRLDLSGV